MEEAISRPSIEPGGDSGYSIFGNYNGLPKQAESIQPALLSEGRMDTHTMQEKGSATLPTQNPCIL